MFFGDVIPVPLGDLNDHFARLVNGHLAAKTRVELQIGGHVETVGLVVVHLAQQLGALDHVHVIKGAELLSEMDDDEADRLDMAADLQLNSRLGCQVTIDKPGEVVVKIPEWNRNYVSEEHH